MVDEDVKEPGLPGLLRKFLLTSLAAAANRGELLQVEFEEEKNRALELFIWAVAVCFLAFMFLAVLTATVILMFPAESRVYAAGGFALLYLLGAGLALLNLKAQLKHTPPPFAGTIGEIKKDRQWLESLK